MNTATFVALTVIGGLTLVTAVLVLGVLRRVVPALEQSHAALTAALQRVRVAGLPAGATVQPFAAKLLDGEAITDADLRGEPSVVVFLSSDCAACYELIDAMENGAASTLSRRLFVVVKDSDRTLAARLVRAGQLVVVQERASVSAAFESDRTPHAFALDADAVVLRSGWPNGWSGLIELVATTESEERGGGDEADDRAVVLV